MGRTRNPTQNILGRLYNGQVSWSISTEGYHLPYLSIYRFLSASTARPPILHEEDCDVLFACEDSDAPVDRYYTETLDGSRVAIFKPEKTQQGTVVSVSIQSSNEESRPSALSSYAVMCRGVVLLGRVTSFINRGNRKPKSVSAYEPDSPCSKLDQQIDALHDNLPNHFKDIPSNVETYRSAHGERAQRLGQRFLLVSVRIRKKRKK